jgi:hypothetical protein
VIWGVFTTRVLLRPPGVSWGVLGVPSGASWGSALGLPEASWIGLGSFPGASWGSSLGLPEAAWGFLGFLPEIPCGSVLAPPECSGVLSWCVLIAWGSCSSSSCRHGAEVMPAAHLAGSGAPASARQCPPPPPPPPPLPLLLLRSSSASSSCSTIPFSSSCLLMHRPLPFRFCFFVYRARRCLAFHFLGPRLRRLGDCLHEMCVRRMIPLCYHAQTTARMMLLSIFAFVTRR